MKAAVKLYACVMKKVIYYLSLIKDNFRRLLVMHLN